MGDPFALIGGLIDLLKGGPQARAAQQQAQTALAQTQATDAARNSLLQTDQLAGQNDIAGKGLPSLGPDVFANLRAPVAASSVAGMPPVSDTPQTPGEQDEADFQSEVNARVNRGANQDLAKKLTSLNPEAWYSASLMQDPGQWSEVEAQFPHVKNKALIPAMWDAHIAELQPEHARPIRFPGNLGAMMGGSGAVPEGEGPEGLGFTNRMVMKPGADGKPSFEMQKVVHRLSDDQKDMLRQNETEGVANLPDAQQPLGTAFVGSRRENRTLYTERVNKLAPVQSYISGAGEVQGVLPVWQAAVKGLGANLSPDGKTLVGDLNPLQQKDLLMALGRAMNPGMGVREWELELLSKGAPIWDRIGANVESLKTGTKIPASVMQKAWDILNGRKEVAQKNFNEALVSFEPELAEHNLTVGDVVRSPQALKEFRAEYGARIDPAKPAALPVGARYHYEDPDTGRVVTGTYKGAPTAAVKPVAAAAVPGRAPGTSPVAETGAPAAVPVGPLAGLLASVGSGAPPSAPLRVSPPVNVRPPAVGGGSYGHQQAAQRQFTERRTALQQQVAYSTRELERMKANPTWAAQERTPAGWASLAATHAALVKELSALTGVPAAPTPTPTLPPVSPYSMRLTQ